MLLLVVGSGRSGTTVLRNALNAHPAMAMTHEAHFLAPVCRRRKRYERAVGFRLDTFLDDLYANPNFRRQDIARRELEVNLASTSPATTADAVREVFRTYAAARGKPRFGDKTPGYVSHIGLIASVFPESGFVHLVRDGRDVALAYLDRPEWGPSTLAEAAFYWRDRVERGRRAGVRLGRDRYHEIRYEGLVADPATTLAGVCRFTGLEFREEMLAFHEKGEEFIASSATPGAFGGLAQPITGGMRDWRRQMDPDDVAFFEAVAGETLTHLGYERTTTSTSPVLRRRVAREALAWQAKRVVSRFPKFDTKRRSR